MPCTFIYLRVSTTGQTTDTQLQEVKAAGLRSSPAAWSRRQCPGMSPPRSGTASRACSTGWNPARSGVGCERHPGPAGLAFALHEPIAGALPSIAADVKRLSPAFHAEQQGALPDQALGASTAFLHKQTLNRLQA